MTCRVLVQSSDGSTMEARAILDSGSAASFVSERLAQGLHLSRSNQNVSISGVAGFVRNSSHPITSFQVSSLQDPCKRFPVTAVIVSHVTSDLPLQPIPLNQTWNHLSGLQLADPNFGSPGKIDLLLGVEILADAVLHGRRWGDPGSPVALETHFGWALAGSTNSRATAQDIVTHHTTVVSGDDLLRRFWELEQVMTENYLTPEERSVMDHFRDHHTRVENGRFMVPLPKKLEVKPIGESRSQAVCRFLSFERSLHSKGLFSESSTSTSTWGMQS